MAAEKETLFGTLAVQNGFATESEVELALEAQKEQPDDTPKIGAILVEMGTIDQQKVEALLVEQAVLRKDSEAAAAAPTEAPVLVPKVEEPPPAAPGLVKRLLRTAGEKLRRLFRDMTGKRAREKAEASDRRDRLLCEIATAALDAKSGGAEADAVVKAAAALEEAKKKTGVAGKSAIKAAEAKHQRALLKLGRTLADKGADPAKAAELKSLDDKIKDLS